MRPTPRPVVKICCIGSLDEAWAAIRAGASAVGLVSAMPSGPGVIADELIAEIAARIPPPIATFLLTSAQDPEVIIAQQRASRANTLQLTDRVASEAYQRLRTALPGIGIVQVVHVVGPSSVGEALAVAPQVDAILLDSGDQSLAVKVLGGTGRVHDWALSARIRDAVDVPVFLAGGLRADNVRLAIHTVAPFGLDVCSGVRRAGRLNEVRLAHFFRTVHAASGRQTSDD